MTEYNKGPLNFDNIDYNHKNKCVPKPRKYDIPIKKDRPGHFKITQTELEKMPGYTKPVAPRADYGR